MQDFWESSGFQHLLRNDHGWLRVTADYFRMLWQRPELAPIAESGPFERALHARLLVDPCMAVSADDLAAIEDADTRENYQYFLQFRQRLEDAVTLERFYLQLFRQGTITLPPIFIDWVVQAIVRGLLEGCEDPYEVRAGEMFFRRQRVSIEGGQVLAADAETIQLFAETGGFGNLGRLFAQQGTPLATVKLGVMNHENAPLYWLRENRYAYLLDLTHGRAGEAALARLLARWVAHFLGVQVEVEPLASVQDAAWRWHVGLDAEASRILDDLYQGFELDADRQSRLIALFRLGFVDQADMQAEVAGKPVYLGMAIAQDNVLKLKPQNLLLNLPLAKSS